MQSSLLQLLLEQGLEASSFRIGDELMDSKDLSFLELTASVDIASPHPGVKKATETLLDRLDVRPDDYVFGCWLWNCLEFGWIGTSQKMQGCWN